MMQKKNSGTLINFLNSNLFEIFIVLFFIDYRAIKLISNVKNGDYGLDWPGTMIIPVIQSLKNNIINDYLVKGLLNSPYRISAQILTNFLPDNNLDLLTFYSCFSSIFYGLINFLSIITISFFVFLIIKSSKIKIQLLNKKYITAIVFLLFLIRDQNYYFFSIITGFLFGGWNYPINDQLYAAGLSFFFSLCSILFLLNIEYCSIEKLKINRSFFLFFSYCFLIFSILLHPSNSLFTVVLTFVIKPIIFKNNKVSLNWNNTKYIFLLTWLLFILILFFLFPQEKISVQELYRVYILERHPHLLLPSFYWNKLSFIVFSTNICLLVGSVILDYRVNKKLSGVSRATFTAVLLLFLFESSQYIFVELFKFSPFIKLGISRMSITFNFLYLVIITSNFLNMFVLLKNNRIINSIKNYFFNFKLYFLRKRIIHLATLVLLTIFLINFQFIFVKKNIAESAPMQLFNEIKSLNIPNSSEFIFHSSTKKLFSRSREIANLKVYQDNYFPFDTKSMLEWSDRKKIKEDFLKCLNNNQFLNCNLQSEMNKSIYLISESSLNYPSIKDFYFINKKYSITKIY